MSGQEFTLQLVDKLAWPVAIIVCALVLRFWK